MDNKGMSNTIVHHHFGHLMGIDVAYCNLQAMQKVKELLKNEYGILR